MKKLLYFVVSVLSLSIIFAAGWASAAGRVAEPAAVNTRQVEDEENPDPDEPIKDRRECPKNREHMRGFEFKSPHPYKNGKSFLPKETA